MNFRTRRSRSHVEISLTPLIDLFLNILTFFLIATTFSSDSVFFVDLPEAKPGESMQDRKSVVINVDEAGRISMDRKMITSDDLKRQLAEIPKEKRGTFPVVLRADRNSRHGSVVAVIDSVRSLGLTNIGIVTQSEHP